MIKVYVRDYDYRGETRERLCLVNPAAVTLIKFIEPEEYAAGSYTARRCLVYLVHHAAPGSSLPYLEVYDENSIVRLLSLVPQGDLSW